MRLTGYRPDVRPVLPSCDGQALIFLIHLTGGFSGLHDSSTRRVDDGQCHQIRITEALPFLALLVRHLDSHRSQFALRYFTLDDQVREHSQYA